MWGGRGGSEESSSEPAARSRAGPIPPFPSASSAGAPIDPSSFSGARLREIGRRGPQWLRPPLQRAKVSASRPARRRRSYGSGPLESRGGTCPRRRLISGSSWAPAESLPFAKGLLGKVVFFLSFFFFFFLRGGVSFGEKRHPPPPQLRKGFGKIARGLPRGPGEPRPFSRAGPQASTLSARAHLEAERTREAEPWAARSGAAAALPMAG